MLLTACVRDSKPVKPEPCKVWALPPKMDVGETDVIVLKDNLDKEWVAMPIQVAGWIDLYLGSVDRQQLLLSTCPYVEFVELGGGDSLKKVDWSKVNLEIGKAGG